MRTVPLPRWIEIAVLGIVLSGAQTTWAGPMPPVSPDQEGPRAIATGRSESDYLQVHLRSYVLPRDLRVQDGIEDMLSAEVGVAGTHLVGMRVVMTVPAHLRFERLEVGVADGLFLVRERSKWKAVGQAVMSVARWLLIGRLFGGGDASELELSATAYTLLLGNEQLQDDAIALNTREQTTIAREDEMTTNHGDFVVCRMVVAMNELSELINLTIWATDLDAGEPVRFVIPRLRLPEEEEQG